MADNTLATWAPFLYELKGTVQEAFPSEAPLLAELSGYDTHTGMIDHASMVQRINRDMDGGRTTFSGKWVRVPVILAGLQGGGAVTQTSTWNPAQALSDTEAHINLVDLLVPFTLSVDVERDSFDNSSRTAVTELVHQARTALARLENFSFNGDGTGLIAAVTAATGSPGLVIPVGTGANFDYLLPGTIVDIRTRTTGANPGNGNIRLITSVQESAGTITVDTASQGGDSGNVTFAATEGVYVTGSYSGTTPGALMPQGLEQICATTGTFENINKANVPGWQGTDGRKGDTTTLPLSATMLQGGVRIGRRAGLGKWDFGIGDPAAIDLYIQSLQPLVRYDSQTTTLKSGFSGITYDGADAPFPLIKEPMHKKSALKLIDKASLQLYGDQPGPSFLEDDGSMFRRTTRTLIKEADLLDRVQLGALKCNTTVFFNNLQLAP